MTARSWIWWSFGYVDGFLGFTEVRLAPFLFDLVSMTAFGSWDLPDVYTVWNLLWAGFVVICGVRVISRRTLLWGMRVIRLANYVLLCFSRLIRGGCLFIQGEAVAKREKPIESLLAPGDSVLEDCKYGILLRLLFGGLGSAFFTVVSVF